MPRAIRIYIHAYLFWIIYGCFLCNQYMSLLRAWAAFLDGASMLSELLFHFMGGWSCYIYRYIYIYLLHVFSSGSYK